MRDIKFEHLQTNTAATGQIHRLVWCGAGFAWRGYEWIWLGGRRGTGVCVDECNRTTIVDHRVGSLIYLGKPHPNIIPYLNLTPTFPGPSTFSRKRRGDTQRGCLAKMKARRARDRWSVRCRPSCKRYLLRCWRTIRSLVGYRFSFQIALWLTIPYQIP